MPQSRGDGKKRKRAGRPRTVFPAVLLILALCVTAAAVFFRVREVEVEGQSLYSDVQIREAADIKEGTSLILSRSTNISAKIFESLPYVEAIQIHKKLPGTILITVTESSPVACIRAEGSWWVLDASCRVMQETDESHAGKLIEIIGLRPDTPEVGKSLVVPDRDIGQELSGILASILRENIADKVTKLDCTDGANVKFLYDGRMNVRLGTSYQAEKKIRLMMEVLEELEADAEGTLDLSTEEKARFIPGNL